MLETLCLSVILLTITFTFISIVLFGEINKSESEF